MAIFGWLCLLAMTLYFAAVSVTSAFVTAGFGGRVGRECWFFFLATVVLAYLTVHFAPFTIVAR